MLAIREDTKIFVELSGGFGFLELEGECGSKNISQNNSLSLKKAKIECIRMGLPIHSLHFGDCIVKYLN